MVNGFLGIRFPYINTEEDASPVFWLRDFPLLFFLLLLPVRLRVRVYVLFVFLLCLCVCMLLILWTLTFCNISWLTSLSCFC